VLVERLHQLVGGQARHLAALGRELGVVLARGVAQRAQHELLRLRLPQPPLVHQPLRRAQHLQHAGVGGPLAKVARPVVSKGLHHAAQDAVAQEGRHRHLGLVLGGHHGVAEGQGSGLLLELQRLLDLPPLVLLHQLAVLGAGQKLLEAGLLRRGLVGGALASDGGARGAGGRGGEGCKQRAPWPVPGRRRTCRRRQTWQPGSWGLGEAQGGWSIPWMRCGWKLVQDGPQAGLQSCTFENCAITPV
jgi:hypothetical protein